MHLVKAAVHTRYGPPDVVALATVGTPAPGANDLLVKVHATTVNRTDCHYRAAKPVVMRALSGLARPRATILGNEFAGEVEAIGPDVTAFVVGDPVFGYCEGPFGAHAEYLVTRADGPVALMPENLSFDEVAPATEGSHYALSHIRRAGITSGQAVLVYGATGSIGSAAVQLLASMGARVTGVCATEQLELVRGLGAARVVDYTTTDSTADDQRYDVVFDAVGKAPYGRCRRVLKPGGIYMSTGAGRGGQNLVLTLISPLLRRSKVLFAFPKIDQQMLDYVRQLMEAGEFRPLVDRRYPLAEIVEAYRYVETGRKIGNVVIVVDPPD
jgi:NADPH:quinone reductase-like Zn-dependent oxidoreductase